MPTLTSKQNTSKPLTPSKRPDKTAEKDRKDLEAQDNAAQEAADQLMDIAYKEFMEMSSNQPEEVTDDEIEQEIEDIIYNNEKWKMYMKEFKDCMTAAEIKELDEAMLLHQSVKDKISDEVKGKAK